MLKLTRNKKPDDLMGFYVLHEGFIGVFDEELKEMTMTMSKIKKLLEKLQVDGLVLQINIG